MAESADMQSAYEATMQELAAAAKSKADEWKAAHDRVLGQLQEAESATQQAQEEAAAARDEVAAIERTNADRAEATTAEVDAMREEMDALRARNEVLVNRLKKVRG